MRILAVADEEDRALYHFYKKGSLDGIDLILSCGDLEAGYLEFLVTMAHCPLLYVHGNHDAAYLTRPPEGCVCIEDRVYDYRGLRILGLGGSMRYHPDKALMYTEEDMNSRIRRCRPEISLKNGFDILLTHAPAYGHADMEDLPHQGFACFNDLLFSQTPRYMIHGHVHPSYGRCFERTREHPSGTTIINACGKYEFEIGNDEFPASGKTGSFIYDLYTSMKKRE